MQYSNLDYREVEKLQAVLPVAKNFKKFRNKNYV